MSTAWAMCEPALCTGCGQMKTTHAGITAIKNSILVINKGAKNLLLN
jgi:hypothetical protein